MTLEEIKAIHLSQPIPDKIKESIALGKAHFVAVWGTPEGDGTYENPWDLQTALSHPSKVNPGDTIWLRGIPVEIHRSAHRFVKKMQRTEEPLLAANIGTYHGSYDSRLNGEGLSSTSIDYLQYSFVT